MWHCQKNCDARLPRPYNSHRDVCFIVPDWRSSPNMRKPSKPFTVEVRRSGRVSSRPAKDIWATADSAPSGSRLVRRDADRAFAAAVAIPTPAAASQEPTGRLLVAEGYRSPLDLRLDEDEKDRAGRRRRAKTRNPPAEPLVSTDVADQIAGAPVSREPTTRPGVTSDCPEPLTSSPVSEVIGRTASKLPRHMRWMRRLRYQVAKGR